MSDTPAHQRTEQLYDRSSVVDISGEWSAPEPAIMRYGRRSAADLTITPEDTELLSGTPQPLVPMVPVSIEE